MEHQVLHFTPEEKRRIEERWLAAKLSEIDAFRAKYAHLEEQIQAMARHLHVNLEDA